MATKPKKERDSNHRLDVSDEGFEMMVKAISLLSLERRSFANLKTVVTEALESIHEVEAWEVQAFKEALPVIGPISVHIRMRPEEKGKLLKAKAEFCKLLEEDCGVRELVVFCCYWILNRN